MPRKLDHYYESSLRGCSVVYDGEGWPVHPKTKERTVQLVSKYVSRQYNYNNEMCYRQIIRDYSGFGDPSESFPSLKAGKIYSETTR